MLGPATTSPVGILYAVVRDSVADADTKDVISPVVALLTSESTS